MSWTGNRRTTRQHERMNAELAREKRVLEEVLAARGARPGALLAGVRDANTHAEEAGVAGYPPLPGGVRPRVVITAHADMLWNAHHKGIPWLLSWHPMDASFQCPDFQCADVREASKCSWKNPRSCAHGYTDVWNNLMLRIGADCPQKSRNMKGARNMKASGT